MMDRNKGAYKLKGLPPIYCINLDDQTERWEYMVNQFKYWEIDNYTRVPAYDGREDDLGDILKGRYPDMCQSGEIGCVTSHLNAIKQFYDSGAPVALMVEDDLDLDLVRFWNFTWKDFYGRIPYDWDVCQISIICTGDVHVKIHKRFVNEFSTAAYLITRHHAEKLIRLHCRGDKYKLDNDVRPRPVADDLIYNSGNTYAIPLLLYRTLFESSIHQDHVEVFHKSNYQAQYNYWSQAGAQMTIEELMNFDPYLGRVTNPSGNQGQKPE